VDSATLKEAETTMNRQKLELTWIGKEHRPRLEPRILLEEPALSYHADERVTEDDLFDNRLIFGDNLLALKALEQEFAGRLKCIYIDPPFNTGAAFTHYDDGLEHSLWLTMMRDRLELLRGLLREDGLIFVHIDYREMARLKLLMDEIFPGGFKNEIIVKRGVKNVQAQFDTIDALSNGHDSILLYAKSPHCRIPKLYGRLSESRPGTWNNHWRGTDRPRMRFELLGVKPERGQWRWGEQRSKVAVRNWEEFIAKGYRADQIDEYYLESLEQGIKLDFIRESETGKPEHYVPPTERILLSDVWLDINVAGRQTDFEHEKKEELLERIIGWVTRPGDWVLDSFAGSGTTGAVAHKMGRRWIMVELGEHCHTHIIPRLRKVIDGTDQGGISKAVGWKGGGGFRYFRLAPSLLERDRWGNWVVNKTYNAEMLAEAMCKHEGFTYAPSDTVYWQHGHSTEQDFIYVTTQTLSHEQLAHLSEEVGDERSLLICCFAWRGSADAFPNLTLKKIPNAVLNRCEWGRDDYSLNVANLPSAPPEPPPVPAGPSNNGGRGRRKPSEVAPELPLFADGGGQ
jgi:adenine-specific DNA-methyltransferase